MKVIRNAVLLGLCLLAVGCSALRGDSSLPAEADGAPWVIATWNVEHLAYPATAGCKPRDSEELSALRAYASSLNADIVGLQEVASTEAINLIFPEDEWQLYLSGRPDSEPYECRRTGFTSTQQKVAYAVRKGIEVKDVRTLADFGLDEPGLRHGLELVVDSPLGEVHVLNVHMKSGCFVDNYSRADSEACEMFARQAPVLDRWIEERERLGTPYIALGDFNHRLSAPYNHLTRQLTTNSDGSDSTLVNTTAHLIGCHPWYPAPIDHIFVGGDVAEGVQKVGDVVPFDDMEVEAMLSDHCAMTLTLSR